MTIEALIADARYALRCFLRSPGYAVVAILTLAIGIGANTAIFTVINGVLVEPLPYADSDRLVALQHRESSTIAPATLFDWRGTRSFSAVGAEEFWAPNWVGTERAEELKAVRLTANMLPLLGVRPLIGRMFLPEEEHAAQSHVVVLTYELWQNRFAGDESVVGRTVILDGESYTVIGVMPARFRFTPYWATDAQLAAPLVLDGRETDRKGSSLRVFGRLAPGATLDGARREMEQLLPQDLREAAGAMPVGLKDLVVGDVRRVLLILLAAVGFVLLIACANVAHLQLVRAAARERESAVRAAIGASRIRLIQQSLVESTMLSFFGALLGLALAWAGTRVLVTLGASSLPRVENIHIDMRVLLFTLGATLLSAVVFGLAPALTASRADVYDSIREGARSAADSARRRRVRDMLVVSEFALAVVLLVSVGLVLRSFVALLRVDPGYDTSNVVSMIVNVKGTQHGIPELREPFYTELLSRVEQLPGVESTTAINHLPLHGDNWHLFYNVEGQPIAKFAEGPAALFRVVRPGYFRTMRVPLLAGRDFTRQDQIDRARVVIINDVMALRSFPAGTSPIGRRITLGDGSDTPWFTVIGVAKATLAESISADPQPEMYYPQLPGTAEDSTGVFRSLNASSMTLLVRTRANPASIVAQVQRIVQSLDRDAPVSDVITLDRARDDQLAGPRFYLLLLTVFGIAALLLAAIGVYGVISYSVARRTREIGLRMALGASRGDSFRLVVGQGMRVAGVGLLAGVAGALVFARFLGALLFGVRPTDAATFATVIILLTLVAAVASGVPALRATRVQPMRALRSE